jgi:hypothetical protein
MQVIVQVVCSGSRSLREAIIRDQQLGKYGLAVSRQKSPGRNPGWAKLHSTSPEVPGAINLVWDSASKILLSRVVTKEANRPNAIIGKFVEYLLGRRSGRIRAISIHPE